MSMPMTLTISTSVREAITWKEGETDMSCFESRFIYVKTDIPKPAISPAEGAVDAFGEFTVTFPEGYTLSFIDDMSWSYLYPYKNGNRLNDPALKYSVKNVDGKAVFYPVDALGNKIEEPVKLDAGAYVFCPASSYAFGEWNGNFASIPPYDYSFRIEGEVNPDDCFVKGIVRLPDGTPAAGAGVNVIGDGDYYEYATTDENGLYVVSNMPSDPTSTFKINAFDASFEYSYSGTAKFPELKNNVYDITLQGAATEGYWLNVTVTEESGVSILGATVKVNKLEDPEVTDEMGICRFVIPEEVGVEGLSVTVSKEGYAEKTENITWTQGADSMDITVVLITSGSGVTGVEADSDVRYFNLQGNRIAAPAKGETVIRVVNGEARKVVM